MIGAQGTFAVSEIRPRNRIDHILFYGTLRRGSVEHARLALGNALSYVGRRAVRGTAYDLGDYPGLLLGSGKTIADLFRIDSPSVLGRMDRYEGFDPSNVEASLFVRTATRVRRFQGSSAGPLRAWIYVYNHPIPSGAARCTEIF